MENPCIECGGNCCWHEDCECRKVIPMSVIEDIKVELSDKELFYRKQNRSDYKIYGEAFDMCLRIIQKHISGKE